MSGRKIILLVVFGLLFIYAFWHGYKAHRPVAKSRNLTQYLNDAATYADMVPNGAGVQPSIPSPDTHAPADPGAPGDQPLFFGGSVPSTF